MWTARASPHRPRGLAGRRARGRTTHRSGGIGGYDDGVKLNPHILAVTYKDYDHAIDIVLEEFALGGFRSGKELTPGLNDNYAVGVEDVDRNAAVPESI